VSLPRRLFIAEKGLMGEGPVGGDAA